MNRCT